MKISHYWISEHLGIALDPEQMAECLTRLGLEVGSVLDIGGSFQNVVVADIMSVKQHPNADRLRLCEVFDGEQTLSVVCGAPNVRTGLRVAYAKVGAVLSDGTKIKRSKIRGESSQGMLCSEKELGVSDEHDGIIELPAEVSVGEDIAIFLKRNDKIFDIELTPNRGDCFSLRGVLRELCADQKLPFNDFSFESALHESKAEVSVSIQASEACPLFVGSVVEGVDCTSETPAWMKHVLLASNIRPISIAIDITHYVMLTLGQPMHAYDRDSVDGAIVVRYAQDGDVLTLLDGTQPELTNDILLIAEENQAGSRALGLAGIMGGADSGVTSSTTNVFFEAAHFTTAYLVGKARKLGLQTEASLRFERGVDFCLPQKAVEMATGLLKSLAGGKSARIVETFSDYWVAYCQEQTKSTELSVKKTQKKIGVDIDEKCMNEMLIALGIETEKKERGFFKLTSPSHRFDLSIEEDYMEEIARLYGYDKIMESDSVGLSSSKVILSEPPLNNEFRNKSADHLVSLGFNECVSYSFISDSSQQLFFPNHPSCQLSNPISKEMDVMRLSLLPSLLENAVFNYQHQQRSVALFESGLCFTPSSTGVLEFEKIDQHDQLAFVVMNEAKPRYWKNQKNKKGGEVVDFFLLKGILQSLLSCLGYDQEGLIYDAKWFEPYCQQGQSAFLLDADGTKIGTLGMFHPTLLRHHDLPVPIGFCELNWEKIATKKEKSYHQACSIFPAVIRDLAIVVDVDVMVGELTNNIKSWKIKYLVGVSLFDVYHDDSLGSKKSVAFCFEFQSGGRTLTEKQVSISMGEIRKNLNDSYGASIRS